MPRIDALPNELQGLIIKKLDTKSKANLRVASTDMRRAVDDVEPPTGSYERRSGRYQSFWTEKRRLKCHRKHDHITSDRYSKLGYGRARVNGFINSTNACGIIRGRRCSPSSKSCARRHLKNSYIFSSRTISATSTDPVSVSICIETYTSRKNSCDASPG